MKGPSLARLETRLRAASLTWAGVVASSTADLNLFSAETSQLKARLTLAGADRD